MVFITRPSPILLPPQVTLWDTGNMELKGIRNVTRSYFRQSVGVILVYDIGNCETLDHLHGWIALVKESFSWKWKEHVSFVMWGNDRDQPVNPVSPENLSDFMLINDLSEDVCCDVNGYSGVNLFENYHSLLQTLHIHLTSLKHQSADGLSLLGDCHSDLDQTGKEPSSCWC